jgi:PAS domain-containing protein
MILIDPAADGRIVDANLAACRFYGYDHAAFCRKHTWKSIRSAAMYCPS